MKYVYNRRKVLSSKQSVYLTIRYLLEALITILLLPFFLFICAILSIFIILDSGSPILFRQKRYGRNKRDFIIYKFKTMRAGKGRDEERITKVGAILRKYHLDELPQFINILMWDMSFIGPRPIPYYSSDLAEKNIPDFNLRYLIKPGLTGLAQVTQGYTNTEDVEASRIKMQYDLEYIKNISIKSDIEIVLKTIKLARQPKNSL